MGKSKFIEPTLIEQHYSTRIYKGYLYYLKNKFGTEKSKNIVSKTGLDWDYLNQDGNWVSETFAEKFYDTLKKEDLDKDFSYQSALLSMQKDISGPLQFLAKTLLSPAKVYKQVLFFARKLNKIDHIELIELTDSTMKIKFSPRRQTKHIDVILDNWRGTLETVPTLFGLRTSEVKLQELRPREYIYHVQWKNNAFLPKIESFQAVLGFLSILSILNLLSKHIFARFLQMPASPETMSILLVVSFILINQMKITFSQKENGLVKSSLESVIQENESRYAELLESKIKLDRRYKEANLLMTVIKRISSSKGSKQVLHNTIQEVHETLSYDRVLFLSYNEQKYSLDYYDSRGFTSNELELISKYSIDLNETTDEDFHLGNSFKSSDNFLIPVTENYLETLSEQGKKMIQVTKSKSFLACPVSGKSHKYGILLVDYIKENKILNQDDLHIVQNLSNQLGLALDHSHQLENEINLRTQFQRYVPPQVIETLLGQKVTHLDTGKRQEVTILFSDLREFTKMSSKIDPAILVKTINHYFKEMTDLVYKYGGIVDKFMGDGLLAIFNAFDDCPEHQLKASHAAFEMQLRIGDINSYIKNVIKTNALSNLDVGIGLHCGEVILGNIGSKNKVEFTAMGDSVNLASRLVGISKQHGKSSIVASNRVKQAIDSVFTLEPIGYYQLKGYSEKKELFLITDRKSNHKEDTLRAA